MTYPCQLETSKQRAAFAEDTFLWEVGPSKAGFQEGLSLKAQCRNGPTINGTYLVPKNAKELWYWESGIGKVGVYSKLRQRAVFQYIGLFKHMADHPTPPVNTQITGTERRGKAIKPPASGPGHRHAVLAGHEGKS